MPWERISESSARPAMVIARRPVSAHSPRPRNSGSRTDGARAAVDVHLVPDPAVVLDVDHDRRERAEIAPEAIIASRNSATVHESQLAAMRVMFQIARRFRVEGPMSPRFWVAGMSRVSPRVTLVCFSWQSPQSRSCKSAWLTQLV
jgi:hypothetical protein